MKCCAACQEDLPKESYSKKQWKLDQRRCKLCVADNQEITQPSQKNDDTNTNTNEIIKALDSLYLENVDKKISDEELFKPPPPLEDCPICFIRMPLLNPTGSKYHTCCGKIICSGCVHAPVYDDQGNVVDEKKCPFCRVKKPGTRGEVIKRTMKRVEMNDFRAIYNLGCLYRDGMWGFPQDYTKALELWHRAAELGYPKAYSGIGGAYMYGRGVEVDMKKARHYYELAAMKGDALARYNLGNVEGREGNYDRAFKHHMIALKDGDSESLKIIKVLYKDGNATKDDYTTALRLYQTYLSEIKSSQRDEAAAYNSEEYRYY